MAPSDHFGRTPTDLHVAMRGGEQALTRSTTPSGAGAVKLPVDSVGDDTVT